MSPPPNLKMRIRCFVHSLGFGIESCFQTELMSSILSRGVENPLSRVTVATLDDLGYTVDYGAADTFDASHLDESCICNRRDLQLLPEDSTNTQDIRRMQLQELDTNSVRQRAIDLGTKLLLSRSDNRITSLGRLASRHTEVSRTISVIYRNEDGSIGDVIVST